MENKIVIRVSDWMRDEIDKHVKLAGESKSVVIRGMLKKVMSESNLPAIKHEVYGNVENQMGAK